MFVLGIRSKERLIGVHPELIMVVNRAIQITPVDFTVLEGVRSYERQVQLYEAGASMTLDSRHLTGHAVDLGAWVGGTVRWDWPLYHQIASAMKEAAKELGIQIDAGADWKRFPDGPHFQLVKRTYHKDD